MKRIGLSKKLRFEIFKRDGFVCQYCGRHPPDVVLEVDHIIPVCDGGESNEENLLTACFDCNHGKAGVSLSLVPTSLKEKSIEILEQEEQIAGYRQIMEIRLNRVERDMWLVAECLVPNSSINGMRRDWIRSIKIFNQRLPLEVVLDAADIANSKKPYADRKRFLYFCGICWNKIKSESGSN